MFAVKTKQRERYEVSALASGLRAFEAFSSARARVSLTEIAKATGLTRAAARRYLITLEMSGYARFDGKYYQLTAKVLRLGHAYLSCSVLPQIAQPVLEELGHRLAQFTSLNVMEGDECITIACSSPRRLEGGYTRLGTCLPIFCSAAGRVLLADRTDSWVRRKLRSIQLTKFTPKTEVEVECLVETVRLARNNGFAINDEEVETGIRVIAVPVYNTDGQAVAALSVSTYATRVSAAQVQEDFLSDLRLASEQLSKFL